MFKILCIIALTGVRSNSLKGVNHMTICPIALAVGCEKCPAFKLCPLTYVLGDQQEEEESFPTAEEEVVPEKKKPLTKDERLALIKESAEKKSADDIDGLS